MKSKKDREREVKKKFAEAMVKAGKKAGGRLVSAKTISKR